MHTRVTIRDSRANPEKEWFNLQATSRGKDDDTEVSQIVEDNDEGRSPHHINFQGVSARRVRRLCFVPLVEWFP